MHPPFSFRSCRKENGPCTVQKKRTPFVALRHLRENGPCTVQKKRTPFVALRHLRASALYGGRREMVPACSRWPPDGRGGMRWELERGFPRRGCGGHRGARTHLTSSSFRAFRFATRSPGGRGGLHQLPSTAKPAAAKREAAQCDNHPDEVGTIRHGTAVSISQKIVACPKVGPNRRLHRYADPRCARRATAPERAQAIFSLPPGAAHSLFVKNKKRMGGAPLWEQPPWREPDPRGRRPAAPISPGG